jgi:hypothetical protein
MKSNALTNGFAVALILVGCAAFGSYWQRDLSASRPRRPHARTQAPVNKAIYAAVVVRVLEKPLHAEESELEDVLFGEFANQPDEKKFESYTTTRWRANFQVFARALITRAEDRKLDSGALEEALGLISDDSGKLAYLPVGAYQATLNGRLVWIVTVKWEGASWAGESLSHIRIYVFDQQTLKQVGFVTCG